MAVGRQLNWKGQMRVDVPHLRALESSIVYDFDTLAGVIMGGAQPYVVTGFTMAWTAGQDPETLELVTADGVILNYLASENGTMLQVPTARAPELLAPTNSRLIGGWSTGVNYIALDFKRAEDSDTSDIVQFIDATTLSATPKTIPLGRTLDYTIHVSTIPFSSTPNLCPIAKVTVDGGGLVTTVEDARSMYFRLAQGGDSPNPLGVYSWPQGRLPENSALFVGGDKAITNDKDWKSAIMHRIWEVTGGEYWYSDVTDRNVKFYADWTNQHTRASLTNNVIWDGTNLTWSGLHILLDNGTSTINDIDDQSGTSPGLTDMADGEVIYVELNRFIDGANLAAAKVSAINYALLAAPTRPGSRYILFWRKGADVYSRLDWLAVGRYSGAATTTTYGVVKINTANVPAGGPYAVISDGLNGKAIATGLTRGALAANTITIGGGANDVGVVVAAPASGNTIGLQATGLGSGSGLKGTGGTTGYGGFFIGATGVYAEGQANAAAGILALGTGTNAQGVHGEGSGTGCGVYGLGGNTAAYGVEGYGSTTAAGVYGEGGGTSGHGVSGKGGAPNGNGVVGTATGGGVGVVAYATTNYGMYAESVGGEGIYAQSSNNDGVLGIGIVGVHGQSGADPGQGVLGDGSSDNVLSAGVVGSSNNKAVGVRAIGSANRAPLQISRLAADPTNAGEGDIYINSGDNTLRYYSGGAWRTLGP